MSLELPPISRQWHQSWYISPCRKVEWLDRTFKEASGEHDECEEFEVPERRPLQSRNFHRQAYYPASSPRQYEENIVSERHSIGVASASEASGLIYFRQSERSAVSANQVKHPVSLSQLPADSFWAGRDERRHLQPSALSLHPTTAQPRSHQRARNCISHSREREREGETSSVQGAAQTVKRFISAAFCVRQAASIFFFLCPAFFSL